MAKTKELSGFEQMMEDIRTGNHKGGIMTVNGWGNPDTLKIKNDSSSMNAGRKPGPKSSKSGSMGTKTGSKRVYSSMEDEEDKENRHNQEEEITTKKKSTGRATGKPAAKRAPDNPPEEIITKKSTGRATGKPAAKRAPDNSPEEIITKKSTGRATGKPAAKAELNRDPDKYDVSDIQLDGEAEGEVEIYETCDSIRAMVTAHLSRPYVVQAAFLRAVSQQFGDSPKKITAAQLRSFMQKKGAHAGGSAAFFYGAYVYFEKLRIKNGEPKSEFREDMEDIWEFRPFEKQSGFPRTGNRGQTFIVPVGRELYEDEYGQAVPFM